MKFQPRFWEDSDSHIAVVKTIRRRYQILKQDAGGEESFQRDLLVQRAVFLAVILEKQEVEAAEGGHLDLGSYVQGCNALSGLLIRLGLEKRIKNVSDLKTYLEERER